MKRILLLAACMMAFASLNAQTLTAGHVSITVTDSVYHDSTTCSCSYTYIYHVTVDSSYTGETLNIIDTLFSTLIGSEVNTAGTSPWIFDYSFATGNSDYFYLGGHPGYAHFAAWVTKVTCGPDTLRYVTNYDSLYVPNSCTYDTAQGHLFVDYNSNCIFDSGDVGLNDPRTNIVEHVSSPLDSLTGLPGYIGTDGWYSYLVQRSWMTDYIISLPPSYAFIFPTSPCFTGHPPYTTLPQSGIDFPLQCTSNIDVQCYALSPGTVRLHSPFNMEPFVNNTGCDMASGELTLVKDSRVIYDPALSGVPADVVHGDTLIWNYWGLTNLSSLAYWNSFTGSIHLAPDSTVVVGDTLCFRIYTNILPADINPTNNDYSFCLPVVYSYDPNSKEVSPKGKGPQGYIPAGPDTLTYTINFQNTGTASANDIIIIDTLDSHINPQSLRILGTSHKMDPIWLAPGVVAFKYNSIFLPDSGSNEPASHGSVRFSVVLNAGLPYETKIKNTGYIYFDANAAVVTNTTLNTIERPNVIRNVLTNPTVKVYPNPATDHIVVENLDGGELSILNMNGSVLIRQSIGNNKTQIDVSALPAGMYILKTVNDLKTSTTKFTKY